MCSPGRRLPAYRYHWSGIGWWECGSGRGGRRWRGALLAHSLARAVLSDNHNSEMGSLSLDRCETCRQPFRFSCSCHSSHYCLSNPPHTTPFLADSDSFSPFFLRRETERPGRWWTIASSGVSTFLVSSPCRPNGETTFRGCRHFLEEISTSPRPSTPFLPYLFGFSFSFVRQSPIPHSSTKQCARRVREWSLVDGIPCRGCYVVMSV